MSPGNPTASKGLRTALVLLLGVIPATSTRVASQTPVGPVNMDFESGPVGGVPAGWTIAGTQRIGTALLTNGDRRRGRQAVVLAREDAASNAPTNLMQQFPAAPFAGRRVRYRMAVRADVPPSTAQLWMRIDGAAATGVTPVLAFFDDMDDRPITSTAWAYYDIVADVPNGAATIALGVFLAGTGRAWVDDGTFEVLGTSPPVLIDPPRALTTRGLMNVVAFAKLLGYVRHFHPSDEAAAADWDTIAVDGVRAVENADGTAALVKALQTIFTPLAPTVQIIPTGRSLVATPLVAGRGQQLLAWHHEGYAQASSRVYRSQRQVVTDSSLFDASLGGGVSVRVPLAVLADATGTLPRAPRQAGRMPPPTKTSSPATDRATRLAAIILAWNVLEHFYPYFDVVNSDWNEILRPALEQAAIDSTEREFALTLRHLLAGLRDGHARVTSAADAAYVPALALEWVEGQLVVTDAAPVTGLGRGDLVIAIDGAPAPLALEDQERSISGATPQWIRARALQEVLSGPSGSSVRLRVERAGSTARRDDVDVARTVAGIYQPPAPREKVTDLQPGVVYVDLTRLNDAELRAALPRLAAAKAIVFELRGYPTISPESLFSHLTDTPITSAQWHVPVITQPDRRDMQFVRRDEWNITPSAPRLSGRIAFVTDARAISYAESCLGIVEYYRLGEIVGSSTAGTNGDTVRFEVPGGYTIAFTGLKVLKHDGSVHHGIGIAPTVRATPTRGSIMAGRDTVLERAVQAVTAP